MELILKTETKEIYYHPHKGEDLIIVRKYDGRELVYNYDEAERLGIIDRDDSGHRIVTTIDNSQYDNYDYVCRRF